MKKRETKLVKLGITLSGEGLAVEHPDERLLLLAFRDIPPGSSERGTILRTMAAVAERLRPRGQPRLSLVVNKGRLNE
ncbi:hypothetical protein [Pseudoduganella sp. UC29_71]|uniref:hypothetical protein n=1 Tax=Pseudoduganella sp. UC29_71 TaxID=3350174 RepID=UPI00366A6EBC